MSGDKTHPLDLLPCPFCGSEAESIRKCEVVIKSCFDGLIYFIRCKTCLARGEESTINKTFNWTEEELLGRNAAGEKWNHRPTLDPQGLPTAGLREAIAAQMRQSAVENDMAEAQEWSKLTGFTRNHWLGEADKILALLAAERERGGEG